MNWEAFGAIAEALGAVGVIVSLVYLATQVRQNTAAIRAGTAQQVTNRAGEVAQSLAESRSLSDLQFRGFQDSESLSEEERRQFHWLILAIFRAYENVEYQYRSGFLDPGEWSGLHRNLGIAVSRPGFVAWWNQMGRGGFSPEFQAVIEELLQGGADRGS